MLRLWNRKIRTATVTRNLVLELKCDTVNKKIKMITTCPVEQATEYLPQGSQAYCLTLQKFKLTEKGKKKVVQW